MSGLLCPKTENQDYSYHCVPSSQPRRTYPIVFVDAAYGCGIAKLSWSSTLIPFCLRLRSWAGVHVVARLNVVPLLEVLL